VLLEIDLPGLVILMFSGLIAFKDNNITQAGDGRRKVYACDLGVNRIPEEVKLVEREGNTT